MKRGSLALVLIFAVVLGTAALASTDCAMTEPFVQFVNDSHMTTSIKTRLATDAHLSTLTAVGVHTSDDVVRLTDARQHARTAQDQDDSEDRDQDEEDVHGASHGTPSPDG